jgi:hypothetical protein
MQQCRTIQLSRNRRPRLCYQGNLTCDTMFENKDQKIKQQDDGERNIRICNKRMDLYSRLIRIWTRSAWHVADIEMRILVRRPRRNSIRCRWEGIKMDNKEIGYDCADCGDCVEPAQEKFYWQNFCCSSFHVDGVRLCFWTAATKLTLHPPSKECIEPRRKDIARKNPKNGEKPVPAPLFPPQIPHGLTRERNRVSVVRPATNRLRYGTTILNC